MQRCFDLARLGLGSVSPNPIVGSVISIPNKIIGEGYHKAYGKAHAEVNAVNSNAKKYLKKITSSTISVSLEPCNFHGNTPACTNLIIEKGIPNVNISTIDRTSRVNSSGVKKLRNNGKEVVLGIKESKGKFIARVRNTFVLKKRPYIILKFAQSKDGFIAQKDKQIWISNEYTRRLVHKWRSESKAILIGTKTAIIDNPSLTTRLYPGTSPLRIIIDKENKISLDKNIKDGSTPTWIYTNDQINSKTKLLTYKKIAPNDAFFEQLCSELYEAKCDTLIVEGGLTLLKSFIKADLWDEARVITSAKMLKNGLKSPSIEGQCIADFPVFTDRIQLKLNTKNVIYS